MSRVSAQARGRLVSAASPGPAGPMQILLVEDFRANRTVLQASLEQQGHRVQAAATAHEALAGFDPAGTDLVLMDLLMPGMDGVEATRRLKAQAGERWIPVILMSGLGEEGDIVRALAAGADDCLVKPVNLVVLEAKLRSFQRIVQVQRQSREHARMLAAYREQAQAELEIATRLIESTTERGSLHDEWLTWSVLPSSRFSGDTVAALRTGSGRLLAMLADAAGHGLPAAFSLLPALQVFYGMARKDLEVTSIAREMNRRIGEHMPTGLYVAAVLVGVDVDARRVQVWNGGMPAGIWIQGACTPQGEALSSRHLPLGVLDDAGFDGTPSTLDCAAGGHLVFYSDGLVEAQNAAGEAFGPLRLRSQLIGRNRQDGLRATLDSLASHLRGQPAHDDVSLLMVALD